MRSLLLFLCLLIGNDSSSVDYTGSRVLRVFIHSEEDRHRLDDITRFFQDQIDIWHEASGRENACHVMVSPNIYSRFRQKLEKWGLDHDVMIDDVQSLIDTQNDYPANKESFGIHGWQKSINAPGKRDKRAMADVPVDIIGTYATWEETENWLKQLDSAFGDTVELITPLVTYEGRNLTIVKISAVPENRRGAPAIWIDTGIHSREWVSYSSGLYLIYKLLDAFESKSEDFRLLEYLDWYIMPVANPDGYAFSHDTEYGDRLWRKNRVPHPVNTSCTGIDLNRNFGFHWAENGVSTNPCSIIFPGDAANSELETQAMQMLLNDTSKNFQSYVSLHSYLQSFFSRWAYTSELPPDHDELMDISDNVAKKITETWGVEYISGTAPKYLYTYAGGSADWAKGVANIKYSYTSELRDKGHYGFLLPVNQSLEVGEEIYHGIKYLAEYIIDQSTYIDITTTTTLSSTETTSYERSGDPSVEPPAADTDIPSNTTEFDSHSTRYPEWPPMSESPCVHGQHNSLILMFAISLSAFIVI